MSQATLARPSRRRSNVDYDAITSADHEQWRAHRELVRGIPVSEIGFRGCLGLSLVITSTTRDSWLPVHDSLFVPDTTVRWATLLDLPQGSFDNHRECETHWATVRPTSIRYGMPQLARGAEGFDAWNFRSMPYAQAERINDDGERRIVYNNSHDILNSDDQPQFFRVFNALEMAMTSTAFHVRKSWQPLRDHFLRFLGERAPSNPDVRAFVYGDDEVMPKCPFPSVWMPRAYLGFHRKHANRLYERSTRVMGSDKPHYTDSLRDAFTAAMAEQLSYRTHFRGIVLRVERCRFQGEMVQAVTIEDNNGDKQVLRFSSHARVLLKPKNEFGIGVKVAEETFKEPRGFSFWGIEQRWREAESLFGSGLDFHLRLWFERQMLTLKVGLPYLYLSSEIASLAALRGAISEELMWDVGRSMPYFNDNCDAFVFPTIALRHWDDFIGALPGSVRYDLTPADLRYRPRKPRKTTETVNP